jgi:peptidyl-prolyl cis-trans isomerase D
MAGIINKIRERVGIAILLIGLAMLGFILSDIIARIPYFGMSAPTAVGVVAGQEIPYSEYQNRVEKEKNTRELVSNQPLDEQGLKFVQDEVWRQFQDELLYRAEYASVGLTVTDAELNDMLVGGNLHPLVKQQFQQSGVFDDNTIRQQMRNFIQQVSKNKEYATQAQQFKLFEQQLLDTRLREKFQKLVSGPAFMSKAEARARLIEDQTRATIEFFAVNYGSIADTLVKPSKKDLQSFYDQHKEEFRQQDDEVVLRYVVFPVKATAADTQAIFAEMQNLRPGFLAQTTAQDDSAYAMVNSDVDVRVPSESVNPADLDPATQLRIAGVPVDSIVGPYLDGNAIRMIKVVQRGPDTVMHYKLKHIFIRYKGNTAQDTLNALQQATQAFMGIGNDAAKFGEAVFQYSEDNESKTKGGEIGWYRYGQFGAKFDKYLKSANLRAGQIVGPIQSELGYHILQVDNADRNRVRVAILAKDIQPSEATIRAVERESENFLRRATNGETFEQVVEKDGFDARTSNPISGNRPNVAGIPDGREIVRWALDVKREAGEVSNRSFRTDEGFVAAYVQKKLAEGYLPLEEVAERIRPRVINELKAAQIKQKIAGLKWTSLDQLRQQYGGTSYTSSSTNITFSGFSVPGLGSEPEVQGAIFALKPGQNSPAIAGKNGVYVVRLTELQAAKPTDLEIENYRRAMAASKRNVYSNRVMSAIREVAKVKDQRYLFGY